MFTKVHLKLAKPVYKAVPIFTKEAQELARPVYNVIPVIAEEAGEKWEWEPEWGDWVITQNAVYKKPKVWCAQMILSIAAYDVDTTLEIITGVSRIWKSVKEAIPILHWENHLEPILEGFGWVLWNMEKTVPSSDGAGSLVVVELAKGKSVKSGRGKDRQEAFQRAILALPEKKET